MLNTPGFELINFDESLKLSDHGHAAHCCIYSSCSTSVFDNYKSSALISMQMRFDGQLGFHGGLIHESNIPNGLNRELKEEINLDEKFFVTEKDYLFTHVQTSNKLCLHFYAKEVTLKDFEAIERGIFEASDFGKETMGIFRVPMFTMNDGYGGLPAFLNNCFVGYAKNQFLNFLLFSKLMSLEEIKVAIESSKKNVQVKCT
ncbi:u8 snoRNA-decapping enzyme [Caerostris darwini]|uniref:U8 snoRNA-decapping enzyme n=1 Tax=Caerostris darwini TaxID=1538125 RepID=A0AAV4X8C5_9ARAC|nr:u8 snoRNA-decapping enzyme [Caerostris darwini]